MIGALLYDCGISNNMLYTPGASSALPANWNTFGYTIGKSCTVDEVRANLDAQYPLTVGIYNNYTNVLLPGHSVVCDGYVLYPSGRDASGSMGDWYFHMNMGWGGASDAWYNASGAYTQVWDYEVALFAGNIFPQNRRDAFGNAIANTDLIISGRVVDASGTPIQGATMTVADATNASISAQGTTDARGIYSFVLPLNVPAIAYTVQPAKAGYVFSPSRRAVSLIDSNLPGNNFSGVSMPTVAIQGVFSVTADDAQFVGDLLAIGDISGAAAHGFCWGVDPNPTTANDSITMPGTGLGPFGASVSDSGRSLLGGTTYHVRAFATNTQGTNYSGDFTFKTND